MRRLDVYRCPGCGRFAPPDEEAPSAHGCTRCGGQVPERGAAQPVSLQALAEAIRTAPIPLLVEFWAPGCAPCLASALVLDAVGHRLAGEAVVLRVDVDEVPEAGDTYGILAVPTVVLFSAGRDRGRRVGRVEARQLEAWVRGLDTPTGRLGGG